MKTAEQISQALSIEQIEFFHTNGYLVVERAIDGELLAKLKQRFSQWVEDSRLPFAWW